MVPPKILDENLSIRHLFPCGNLDETYENVDWDVKEVGLGVPVVVNKGVHTLIFKNSMQRLRFFEKLHLSVPTDLITFCPGSSHTSIFALVQVKEGRNMNEILIARI